MGILESFLAFFAKHAYPLLFLGMMLDTAGLPIPGELLLFAGGYLTLTGSLASVPVILLGTFGAVAGDHVGYLVGRLGGRRLLAYRQFLVSDLLGALLWSAAFVLLGSTLGTEEVKGMEGFWQAKQFLLLLALIGIAGTLALRLWRRARHGAAPLPLVSPPEVEGALGRNGERPCETAGEERG